MNKTAIKNFAIWARVQLMESAKQRAFEYEITETGEYNAGLDTVGGRMLSATEKDQRKQLIEQIRQKGYSQVMEEAAYTWFNRFIALRFMEVNGYLPSKVRVFTDETGAFKPEIVKQAMTVELDGLDRNCVLEMLDKQNNEELYKYLLITQCNALNAGLPYMFEKIANWTELLFPSNLLRPDSIIGTMVAEIPEEDWTDAVQIIGWLYQYYNSELKDETFALLKKNVKITKERIPAATQLFTPDWIVRYMVENSLGRLWYEGHNDFDKSQWKYYLDEAEQEPEVEQQLKKIREEYASIKPEDIKVIDPCMGSGHILVYAFDVLMQIYTSAGWSERDAAQSILENNLYGLDIDDRAGQLAYFAVMMKARKYSRRILSSGVKPNVLSIQDSNWMTDEFIDYVAGKDAHMQADLVLLRKTFKDAKEYGSILNVTPMQYDALYERIDIIGRSYAENLFEARYQQDAAALLLPLVKQAQIMAQKYDVVVTNPPYMGNMPIKMTAFVQKQYPDSKYDLYAVFIEKNSTLLKEYGLLAMITQHSWMFISSFERFRNHLMLRDYIQILHLGTHAFEEIGGEVVQTVAFIIRNSCIKGNYVISCRLVDCGDAEKKENAFLEKKNISHINQLNFGLMPGGQVIYWLSNGFYDALQKGYFIEQYVERKAGIVTGNDDYFLRFWFEPNVSDISFTGKPAKDYAKYHIMSKGGSARRFYGNFEYLIRLREFYDPNKTNASVRRGDQDYYFKRAIGWSQVGNAQKTFRVVENSVCGTATPTIYFKNSRLFNYVLGFLNTKVAFEYLAAYNPTINLLTTDICNLPLIINDNCIIAINKMVEQCILICKDDWDAFETSWDFKKHPLV